MVDILKYTNKLRGARVLLIGGTSGIGFGVAEAVLEHGASDIILASSDAAKVESAIARLKAAYPTLSASISIRGYQCDLSDLATIDTNLHALFEAATHAKTALLDHLVYSAGNTHSFPALADITAANVANAGNVRFAGQFTAAKNAVVHGYLANTADSSVTMTSGGVGERPEPGWTTGAGFMAGLPGFARSLALELRPVRVNVVSPGAIDTELWARFGERREPTLRRFAEILPVGRVGRVEDVAEAYLYMMRDGFVTGSVLSSNGGYLLVGPGLAAGGYNNK